MIWTQCALIQLLSKGVYRWSLRAICNLIFFIETNWWLNVNDFYCFEAKFTNHWVVLTLRVNSRWRDTVAKRIPVNRPVDFTIVRRLVPWVAWHPFWFPPWVFVPRLFFLDVLVVALSPSSLSSSPRGNCPRGHSLASPSVNENEIQMITADIHC